MIKKSTYIRGFTPQQRRQLETVQAANKKLKTVPEILFYALDKYIDQQQEIDRLKRFLALKQAKIEKLTDANGTTGLDAR